MTASDLTCGTILRCNHLPVVATITTRPKTVATVASSRANSTTAALMIEGSSQRLPNTPRVSATDPTNPTSATRKLDNCKRVTARLMVLGITAVTANEITNQTRIASSRVPRKTTES